MADGIQILVDRNVPPSPGDGIVFATVAWRGCSEDDGNGWGAWQRWRGAFVRHSDDPAQQVLFVDDVSYEARNYQGVPGHVSQYLDAASLDIVVQDGPNDAAPDPALLTGILVAEADLVRPTFPPGWRSAIEQRLAALEARLAGPRYPIPANTDIPEEEDGA